jgi:hypothetical protein
MPTLVVVGHARPTSRREFGMERNLLQYIAALIGFCLLAGCVRKTPAPDFPATVAGGWHLKTTQSLPADTAPEFERQIGTRGWWKATYEGPGAATVEVYELTSSAGGLEMVQKWRAVADTVVWYTPQYFVVVKWRGDRAMVSALIRAFEKQFSQEK